MAEALLSLVLEGPLTKAFSLAADEFNRLFRVKKDIQSLAEKLEMVQALLSDAHSKKASSRAVDLWLKRLQDVASKADNLLDDFEYELLHRKLESRMQDKFHRIFSASNPFSFHFKMAKQIKKINFSLDDVYQESTKIGLRPVEIINSTINPTSERITDPFVDDSKIVGRNDDVTKLVSALTRLDDGKELSVIGIVGMAGQGKTTVAQLVYKNEMVGRHFERRIWICVSNDFKVERVLNDMVQSLTGTISELTIREVIVRKLNKELNATRYLLILDDVWNEEGDTWDCMSNCLQEIGGSKGSRILVTTRSERVLLAMQTTFVHHLRILSDDDSWTLFGKTAFAEGGATKTPELMDIGRKIVKKCGGVPLAIKAIGGLLYLMKEESEWSKIEESETWVPLNALDRVQYAIQVSYDHLPSLHLKQCFAFSCLYEKDCMMETEDLIQLWMAQGLLNPSKESRLEMEDIGKNYFNILFQRSLLQDAKLNDYGAIEFCKMHDLVHDFALKATKEFIVKDQLANDEVKAGQSLTFCNEWEKLKMSDGILSKVRTLVLIDGCLDDMLAETKYLRVLVLLDKDIKELPSPVGRLKHLRYLNISGTSITVLPNSVTKLYNLQTLRLYDLQELPKNFGNLVRLRHFHIKRERNNNEKKCLLPGIGRLTSLQTLTFFAVSQERGCQIEELGHLNHLRGTVKLFGLQNVNNQEEARKANLSRKTNLQILDCIWDSNTRNEYNDHDVLEGLKPHSNLKGLKIVNFMSQNLPSWLLTTSHPVLLRNLVKIQLENFSNCEKIPPLGHLPHLRIVKIIGMHSVTSIGNQFYGWTDTSSSSSSSKGLGDVAVAFPALNELILNDMPNLENWSVLERHDQSHSPLRAFPCLKILKVAQCPRLTCLPSIWSNLTCIQQLLIGGCFSLSCLPEELARLSSLEKLQIGGCPNLVSIPSVHALGSLNELALVHCPKLCALPSGIKFLTSLHTLAIVNCPTLQPEDLHRLSTVHLRKFFVGAFSEDLDYFPWPNFTASSSDASVKHLWISLETLALTGWQKLTSLPEQVQHLSALRFLRIAGFARIEALPDWLSNIHSLEFLWIADCVSLKYLPSAEAMQLLANLKMLKINGCPLLKERCEKGSGPEWHKIDHIPEINITDEDMEY